MRQPLPESWVDQIFARLSVRYGRAFMARWDGVDIQLVKADWAKELAGFANWPEAIKWAFDHLDAEKPPTAAMFRDLAYRAPKPDRKQLPEPVADKARVTAEIAKLSTPIPRVDPYTDWISRGLQRIASGEQLSRAVKKAILDAARVKGLGSGCP